MFGYININEQELKLREFRSYRSFYCGMCEELHQRYGRRAQIVLNYDTTFLAILLSGLYEPGTVIERKRCIPHPVHKHESAQNDAIGYSADMCVLLAYQQSMDNWKDERNVSSRAVAALLKSEYNEIANKYPRQSKAVEENIRLLHEVEQGGKNADIDYVSGLTGNFLAELFVWKDDIWQEDLRQIGFYLGKFIYLMDAVEDLERDKRHGNYNVFSDESDIWEDTKKEEIKAILTGMMAEASRAFERLPVVEYAPIIRNIMYSGVWSRYVYIEQRQREKRR